MDKRRVVITGLGVKCAVGNDLGSFWENILAGRHGISLIQGFDTAAMDVKVAAENPHFSTENYFEKKELRRTDRYCQLAVAAACDALEDAGNCKDAYDPFRVGVLLSSGIGGFHSIEAEHQKFLEKGGKRVSVFFVPMMISNMAAGLVAIRTGFQGDNMAIVTACSSSNHALGEAFHKIRDGYLDACVTGGSESAITEFAIHGFNNMTALSRSRDPDRASIPFDRDRDGFVMAEGAAVLFLEELQTARNRGAHIYAEVVGYGATADGYHITSPDPEGTGAMEAMRVAVEDAGIVPGQIDYINAHGTSTLINDRVETLAIRRLFGEDASKLLVSSTKSMTGHLLGAAGAIEALITAKALEEGVVPPTVGYQQSDPDCDLNYLTQGKEERAIQYALSNSLGFGGHNATICLKKYRGE